jgi:calcineurin-like phosphoesterase family protein
MTGNLFARQTWFTADLHLGHENIISSCQRPFETVDEMNRTIIEKWNERVDPADTVWVLGDFALGPILESIVLVSQLHGHKILVAGNHDRCFHGYKKSRDPELTHTPVELARWVATYKEAGFADVVTGQAMLKRTGRPITVPLRPEFGADPVLSVQLSHFPRAGESRPGYPDRYVRYRPRPAARPKDDAWLVHGHVHNGWTVNERQVNVGVDVWDFAPVSAETLLSVITDGMPSCDCSGESHQMGTPGCVLNGG